MAIEPSTPGEPNVYCVPARRVHPTDHPYLAGAEKLFITIIRKGSLMRCFRIPLLLLIAATTIISCGKKEGPTTVESITLMRDDGSGKAGETVESLKPSDRQFHAAIHLERGDDAKVKADLIAVDTPAGKDVPVLSQDYDVTGIENIVNINFSLPNDWPVGLYKIDISINGKPEKSKEFRIE
jgi:hypothetical protein